MAIYIFGYGSLINMQENKELNRAKKICPVFVQGLKRSLNVQGKNHRVFGVKDVKTSMCNGILFKVNAAELARLQEREMLYTMKTLAPERLEFYTKKCFKFQPGDQIICFYPQAKYVLPKSALASKPASPAYSRICQDGAAAISDAFLQDFLTLTY